MLPGSLFGRSRAGPTVTSFTLAAMLTLMGGCMTALMINDAGHMTLERATTPRAPKRFRVLDAETLDPVSGARVVAVYNFDWLSDWFIDGTTDAEGITTLRLAKEYFHLQTLYLYADGYLDRYEIFPGGSGVGELSDDPIDILVYREPAAGFGWRFPGGFRGTVIFSRTARADIGETVIVGDGKPPPLFQIPPAFRPGQRTWWTDVMPGQVTEAKVPPPLGSMGGNWHPIPDVATVGGELVPMPEPGANVEGLALWHVGVRTPGGPWGGEYYISVVGERGAALAQAKALFDQDGNGPTGYIFDGWLRFVAPKAKSEFRDAYAVTRRYPRQ